MKRHQLNQRRSRPLVGLAGEQLPPSAGHRSQGIRFGSVRSYRRKGCKRMLVMCYSVFFCREQSQQRLRSWEDPCLLRPLSSLPVVLHDPWNLERFQHPWDFVRLLADGRVDLRLVDLYGRGSDGGFCHRGSCCGRPVLYAKAVGRSRRRFHGRRWWCGSLRSFHP